MAELFASPDKYPVFVDEPIFPYRNDLYCHLFSEDLAALHQMARRLGLKREWFQEPPKASWYHYDISKGKRKLALKIGCVRTDRYECLRVAAIQRRGDVAAVLLKIEKARATHHYFKVVVTGGRDYDDFTTINSALNGFHKKNNITCLINGYANGLDKAAHTWAESNGIDSIPYEVKKSDWDKHGKRAGILRNETMVREEFDGAPSHDKIKACLSFPGNRGTAHMTEYCVGKNIPTFKLDTEKRRWTLLNPRLL